VGHSARFYCRYTSQECTPSWWATNRWRFNLVANWLQLTNEYHPGLEREVIGHYFFLILWWLGTLACLANGIFAFLSPVGWMRSWDQFECED
jgi:hypothetical protein